MRRRNLLLVVLVLAGTHLAAYQLGAGAQVFGGPGDGLAQPPDGVHEATAKVVAVRSGGGGGVVGNVTVTVEPGKGRVLLDTDPFVETDTQSSAKVAREVAQEVTGVTLEGKNVVYSFDIEGSNIGGPSAGAAMAIATIAAIEGREVRRDAAVTGTIRPDGRIGLVGGVPEKAVVAGEAGFSLLLVPERQKSYTYYEPVLEEQVVGGFVFQDVRYVPKTLDLNNMTTEKFGMETRGVTDVEEAVEAVLVSGED